MDMSAQTYQVGAHFAALIEGILMAPLKTIERFFCISSSPAGLCFCSKCSKLLNFDKKISTRKWSEPWWLLTFGPFFGFLWVQSSNCPVLSNCHNVEGTWFYLILSIKVYESINTPLLTKKVGHWSDSDKFHLFLELLDALSWSRQVKALQLFLPYG